jgi:hypothetical protein
MTTQQFKEASKLQSQIDAKKQELRLFENGKITGLSVRLFNEEKTVYEDKTYTSQLPNTKLKGVMLELLRNDLSSLIIRFNELFKVETQPLSSNGVQRVGIALQLWNWQHNCLK